VLLVDAPRHVAERVVVHVDYRAAALADEMVVRVLVRGLEEGTSGAESLRFTSPPPPMLPVPLRIARRSKIAPMSRSLFA